MTKENLEIITYCFSLSLSFFFSMLHDLQDLSSPVRD